MFRLATKGTRFVISPAGIIEMLFRSPAVRWLSTSSLSVSALIFYFLLAYGSEGCLLVEPSDQVGDIFLFFFALHFSAKVGIILQLKFRQES